MRRFPHYLRSNKSAELPHLLAYVDTETHNISTDPSFEKHALTFGWLCTERTWGDGKWVKPQWFRFETPDELWDIIESLIRKQTRLYLFAHNWAFDAPVLKIFSILPERDWKLTRAIIESPPIILRWLGERKSILCLDTLNWFRFSLEKLGKRVGIEKLSFPDDNATSEQWDTYCKQDVEVVRQSVRSWLKFIEDNNLGGFAPTLASQGLRAFRHRFMNHQIFFDDNEAALKLSREALHGGRTEAFRIGKVDGPIFCYDVNSMYPAVMADNDYPIHLICRTPYATVKDIERWLKTDCVVARVKIETSSPRFAYYNGEKLVFPIGKFTATLTTPELSAALEADELRGCEEAATYERAPIFSDFVDELYRLRMVAKGKGDDVSTYMIKILMNALYGKFAQKGKVWETIGSANISELGYELVVDYPEGTSHEYRKYAGILQERMKDEEGRESFPAIAAHVTAFARLKLWNLIVSAGRENVFYCDTDSLYVNKTGSDNLAIHADDDALGALKLEKTSSSGVIHGAKDYIFGVDRKCKGVKPKAVWLEPNKVEQQLWPKLQGLIRRGSLDAPLILSQEKHLKRVYDKGIVQEDGKVRPLVFAQW